MKNILFVSAQPDVPYFIWQIKLYVHNFIEKGINPKQIHVIFSIINNEPSNESLLLKELGVNVHHYKDNRRLKHYIPSIKPYLISKWIETNPENGKLFFLHDSDIIFRKLPQFDELINDEYNYVSDTKGYIGLDYIKSCEKKYRNKHPQLDETPIMNAKLVFLDSNKKVWALE